MGIPSSSISSINADNTEFLKRETQTENSGFGNIDLGVSADAPIDAFVYNDSDQETTPENGQPKTQTDRVLEMFESDASIEEIQKFCKACTLDLKDLISKNAEIKKIVSKKYPALLPENSEPELMLCSFYSGSDSIAAIDKKFEKVIKKPIDLSNKNKNHDDIIYAVKKLKDKFVKCKTNEERHTLIKQLQKITGIDLGFYNQTNTDIIKRAFAVLYSLSMAVLNFDEEKGFIVDGKKITDKNELLAEINKKLADKENYENTIDKLGCFASLCQKEILDVNNPKDKDLANKISAKVSEQRKYAQILQTKLQGICIDKDKEAKVLEKIDYMNIDSYLDINEYIETAEKVLKEIANISDKDLKDLKINTKKDAEVNRALQVRYLLKIYNDYKNIEAEYLKLSSKGNLTDEEKEKLSKYQKLRDNYVKFIVERKLNDEDFDYLNELGVQAYEDNLTSDQLKELKNSSYNSDFVKLYGKKIAMYEQHEDLISKLTDKKLVLKELSNLNRQDAIKVLKEKLANNPAPEEKQIFESLLKSYETLSDKDIEKLIKWNNKVSDGASFDKSVKEFDGIIASMKKDHPEMSNEQLVLCVTDVVKNIYQDENVEFITRVIDYIAVKVKNNELNENTMEQDLTVAYGFQISEEATTEMKANAVSLHPEDNDLFIYAMSTENAQEVANALQQIIHNNPDAFSDAFKEKVNEYVSNMNANVSGSGSASDGASGACAASGSGTVSDGSTDGGYSFGMHEQSNYNNNNGYSMNWPDSDKTIDKPKNNKSNKSENETVKTSVVINQILDLTIKKLLTNKKLEEMKDAVSSGKYKNGEPVPMPEKIEMVQTIWNESPSQVNTLTWAANSANSDVINIIIHNIPQWDKYLDQTPKSVQDVFRRIQEENAPYCEHKLMKNEEKTVHGIMSLINSRHYEKKYSQ